MTMSAEEVAPFPERPDERLARWALRALWFGVGPALLAGVTTRYLLVRPAEVPTRWAPLVRVIHAHQLVTWVALFLLFASLIHYWRNAIPGGRFVGALPGWLAARIPRGSLAVANEAALLRTAALRSLRREPAPMLGAEQGEALRAALRDLDNALVGDHDSLRACVGRGRHLLPVPLGKRRLWRVGFSVGGTVLAALVALGFRSTVGGTYEVIGASMLPTFEPGDLLLGSRLAYGLRVPGLPVAFARAPRRGDVVIVKNPHPEEGEAHLVKRIIGVPGERIQMQGNLPVINGWRVPVCNAGYYLHASHHGGAQGHVFVEFLADRAYLALYATSVPPFAPTFTVAPGEVFLLGDNRANSSDSRAWNDGRGGGLAFSQIEARAWRFLVSGRLDERADLRMLLQSLDLRPHSPELNLSELEAGVLNCLQQRPTETEPPATEASAAGAVPDDRVRP